MENYNVDENLVILIDEEGNEVGFEHLMTVEHEGNYYIALEEAVEEDGDVEAEVVLLKIVHDDEKDEDSYVSIEDEDELNAVFEKCIALSEEEDALEMLSEMDGEEDEE